MHDNDEKHIQSSSLVNFTKIHIIKSISRNIYRCYACDLLGPHIALASYSIDPMDGYYVT